MSNLKNPLHKLHHKHLLNFYYRDTANHDLKGDAESEIVNQ